MDLKQVGVAGVLDLVIGYLMAMFVHRTANKQQGVASGMLGFLPAGLMSSLTWEDESKTAVTVLAEGLKPWEIENLWQRLQKLFPPGAENEREPAELVLFRIWLANLPEDKRKKAIEQLLNCPEDMFIPLSKMLGFARVGHLTQLERFLKTLPQKARDLDRHAAANLNGAGVPTFVQNLRAANSARAQRLIDQGGLAEKFARLISPPETETEDNRPQ
jgi:hypothetical protein